MGGVELNEKVHVIVAAADGETLAAESIDRSTQVFVERPTPRRAHEWFAIFRGKDEVVIEAEVG